MIEDNEVMVPAIYLNPERLEPRRSVVWIPTGYTPACHEGYTSQPFIAVFSGTDDVKKDILGQWELEVLRCMS